MNITLLNPFSVSLGKHPFMETENKPVYTKGDYRIFRYSKAHYLHAFKNIIFAERCAPNTGIIDNLINDNSPTDESTLFHDYERPKGAILEGIQAAEKLNFTVI